MALYGPQGFIRDGGRHRAQETIQVQSVLRLVASTLAQRWPSRGQGLFARQGLGGVSQFRGSKLKVHSFLFIESGLHVAQARLKFIRLPSMALNYIPLPRPFQVLEFQMCVTYSSWLGILH